MKHINLISMLIFLAMFAAGCTQETTKSSGSSSNPYCAQYPHLCNGTTTGGTTGTPNQQCQMNPYLQGCPYFCQMYPAHASCGGNGGTPGGTTGGTTPNPYPDYNSNPKYPNWGVHYPGGIPAESCSPTFAPANLVDAGITPWDTRKGTITLAGLKTGTIMYSPVGPDAPHLLNTSPDLMSLTGVKNFFSADAVLKLRVKVRPQPDSRQTDTMCYNRNMPGSTMPGYTKLQYYVKVYGINANNSVRFLATFGPYNTTVNGCTPAIDLSQFKAQSPHGVFVAIDQVKANQNCWWDDKTGGTGFLNCNSYKNVRSFDCWQMEFEVAADGTNTFN